MKVKKTIYIIRHGETDFNKRGIIQGSGIDSKLNKTGINQANLFYSAYKHISFKNIYTSELIRTHQSVEPFLKKGITHTPLPELNEINWGIMEGLHPDPYNQIHFNQMVEDWRNGYLDKAIENGESPNSLFERQVRGLEKILSRSEEDIIMICMHGRAMRSFLCLLLEEELKNMDKFKHSNLCLYVLHQTEDLKFKLELENSTDHLW